MPLYEYECLSCGSRTELIQRAGDPPPEACAECGGPLKKLLSAPAVHFKGSGWYVTDYARKRDAGADVKPAEGKEVATKEGAAEGAAKTDGAATGAAKPAGKESAAGAGAKSAASESG